MKKKKGSIIAWGKKVYSQGVEAKKKWDEGATERRKAEIKKVRSEIKIAKEKNMLMKEKAKLQKLRSQNQPSFGFGGEDMPGFGGMGGEIVNGSSSKKRKKKQEEFRLIY